MDHPTAAVINYLEQHTAIGHVNVKSKNTCSSDDFTRWEEKNVCELPEDLKMFYTISDGLDIRWAFKTGTNTAPTFIGKMHINSLSELNKMASTGSKQMAVDELNDFLDNDQPRFNSHLWNIFELDPCDGQGRVCLVYNTYHDLSIWFLDRSLQFHRLASTFTEYYRLLLMHCGLPYWQYKYTDVGIPPYVLHWYYTIVPHSIAPDPDNNQSTTNLIQFSIDKVFQRHGNPLTKNVKGTNQQVSTGQTQQLTSGVGIRSATQNQKRPIQPTKSINRSSSVPRSMNN